MKCSACPLLECASWSPPLLPPLAQGKHRLLFLLYKQSGRVSLKQPAKRQGFQVGVLGGSNQLPWAGRQGAQVGACAEHVSRMRCPCAPCELLPLPY